MQYFYPVRAIQSSHTLVVIAASLVRSIANHSSGKFYFEMKFLNIVDTTKVGIGVDNNVESVDSSGGQSGSILWKPSGVVDYNGNSSVYLTASYAVGDDLDVAVDLTNGLAFFRVNGGNWNLSGSADPVTGVGGFSISAVSGSAYAFAQLESINDNISANFAGPFTDTIPGGTYTNW